MSSSGDQPNKEQLEVLKLRAETQKAEAERDKLQEELRQSKGLLAKLGKVFTPLVAALTIVFGYLAATHSQRVAEADLKVAKADLEEQRLQAEAAAAQHDLAEAQAKLTDTNAKIVVANAAREKAEAAEKGTQDRLSGLQKEYASLQKEQTDRITLGNLRKLIDILDSEPPEKQTADSRYIEDIRKEVAGDNGFRAARQAYLTRAAQDTQNRPPLRGLLYYALFQVTRDNQWLDQIRRLAAQDLFTAWPAFSSLIQLEYFDLKDRADVVCSGYAHYIQQSSFESLPVEVRLSLFKLDSSVFVRCRRPYLDRLEHVRSQALPQKASQALDLLVLSRASDVPVQVYIVRFLKEYPELAFRGGASGLLYDVLRDRHVPEDTIEVLQSGSSKKEWLEKHKKLVDAWTSPGLPELGLLSDTNMRKVLAGVWITEADLP